MLFNCGFEFEYKYPDFFSDKKGIREKFLYLFCMFFQDEKRVVTILQNKFMDGNNSGQKIEFSE